MGSLKNKRVLITAGPTWVAIDDVRVISNISTGQMGLELVKEASQQNCEIDLLLGPVGHVDLNKNIRVKRFRYFQELLDLVKKALKATKYDVIIHCAAVSDYLVRAKKGKILSNKGALVIRMERAPKIIQVMRKLHPESCLVMFKLECGVSDKILLKRAKEAMKSAKADLVIANTFDKMGYRGFILDSSKILGRADSRYQIAKKLFKVLESRFF